MSDSPPAKWYEAPVAAGWCHCDLAFARRALRQQVEELVPEPDWRKVCELIDALLDCGEWGWCEKCAERP